MSNTTAILILFALALGIVIGISAEKSLWQTNMAKTKCAEFSPLTGEFHIIKEK